MFTREDACRSFLSRSTNKTLPVDECPCCSHAGLRSGPMYSEAMGIFAVNLTVGRWPPGHATAASIGPGGESDFKEQKVFGWSTQSFIFLELLMKRGFRDWDGSPVPLFYPCVWFKFYMKPLKRSVSVLQLLWHSHTSDLSKQTPAHKYLLRHTRWGFQMQAIIFTPRLAPVEISFPLEFQSSYTRRARTSYNSLHT